MPSLSIRSWSRLAVALALLAACAGADTSTPPSGESNVARVEVAPSSVTIDSGGKHQLTATVTNAAGVALSGRAVAWASNNPSTAVVSSTGEVTALSVGGPVTITATSEGKAGSATITIASPTAASLSINDRTPSIERGEALDLSTRAFTKSGAILTGRAVTWTVVDTSIATINASGRMTGRLSGRSRVRATLDGVTDEVTVRVYWPYRPTATYESTTSTTYIVRDSARQRDLPFRLRIPIGAPEPMPVVIVAGGIGNDSPTGWSGQFARAGYLVVQFSTVTRTLAEYCAEFAIPQGDCSASVPFFRPMQAVDISTLRNAFSVVQAAAGVQLDTTRVAVSGWSSEAGTSMLLAGATTDITPSRLRVSLADSRFRAYIANSPPGGTPNALFSDASWATVQGPLLIQTGTNDLINVQTPATRRAMWDALPAGNKFFAFYNTPVAEHGSFALNFPTSTQIEPCIVGSAIAFLDAYLRDRLEARTWLMTSQLDYWCDTGPIAAK